MLYCYLHAWLIGLLIINLLNCILSNHDNFSLFKDTSDDNRDKPFMFATSLKPFDLSEATKLSLVLSASQQISQQQLKDSFMKNFSRYATSDFEDTDSRFSFSSSSSPVHVRIYFGTCLWFFDIEVGCCWVFTCFL